MTNLTRSSFQAHPFHLVSPSPWPLNTSISLLSLTLSAVLTFHSFSGALTVLGMSLISIDSINPFELPLLNTVLLLSSGVTVTYAHHSLIQGNRSGALYGLVYTIILAVIFTAFQGVEYTVSSFTISDGTYASCFYFGTGFHGLHVMIGTAFLAVGL
ncbi:hypothetical protein BT93_L4332 [Corymbia citriodora subsp. variegata]|uniref:Cytochrome c oxidase subunit 3 n=1 Tax=Corymbia citriodora subsp. variegata TaxID=360336 RepID=A0A8T0CH29_CORYI|nr:hypothetical protein BT93_L4332 [Corymbia citriodora subsp. variegata]